MSKLYEFAKWDGAMSGGVEFAPQQYALAPGLPNRMIPYIVHILRWRNTGEFYAIRTINGEIQDAYGPLPIDGRKDGEVLISEVDWSPELAVKISAYWSEYEEITLDTVF